MNLQSHLIRFTGWFALGLLAQLYSAQACAEDTAQAAARETLNPATQPAPQPVPQRAAAEVTTQEEVKGPPLPLHSIEGTGGIFATHTAYLVNPPRNGDLFGLPAVEATYVNVGRGRFLTALTATENIAGRVELGFGWEHFDLGDLPEKVQQATSLTVHEQAVDLQNFNVRGLLVKDGDFKQAWVPAVTLGVHYKLNDSETGINRDLNGTLRNIGITGHEGMDYTLYTTKMIKVLPRPVLVSAGVRASRAAELGLLGFTREYKVTGEGNIGVLATNHLIFAVEFRQKESDFKPIPTLISKEHDWFTADVAYIVTNRLTVAGGYGYFGQLLNHNANGVFGLKIKWEF